jgi:hypothetical protein
MASTGPELRIKKVTQSIEERSFFQIMIVLPSKFLGWNNQLDGNKLVSFSLESGQDLRNLWQRDDDCYCCCFERNEMHHSPKRNYQCTETKQNRAKV